MAHVAPFRSLVAPLVLCAMFSAPTVDGAVKLPDGTIPGVCGVQLKAHNANPEELDAIQKLGIKYVRRGFIWSSVEKKAGEYDFSAYDKLVKECRDRGLRILGCIALGNDAVHGPVREERGREAYARYAAALVERYKDEDIIWELWNEPNVRTFWGKHGMHNSEQYADEYMALVRAAVPAMKKANPDCFIMAGSVSGLWSASYEWQRLCFQKGVLKTGIDAWSVHPYSMKMPEDYIGGYALVRKMMADAGGPADIPMLNSERGFPLGKAEGFAGGDMSRALEYQAWHLVRQYMIDQLSGMKLTIWYEWSGEEGFSLKGSGSEPGPAMVAAETMLKQLDGYRVDQRLATASDRDFVLRFTKPGAADKLVAWTAPPEGETPDKAAEHEVQVPTTVSGWVQITDIYGNTSGVQAAGGSMKLKLSGGPQYVTLEPLATEPATNKRYTAPRYTPPAAPTTAPAAKQPAEVKTNLDLFATGTEWKFQENTGKGSFETSADGGKLLGVMRFNFTGSTTKSVPYVIASAPATIPEAAAFQISARSSKPQRVTIRLIDSTGQTHQAKFSAKGTNDWEPMRIPLDKKMEHWDGANDGKVHYPIKAIAISLPLTDENKTGEVEFADAMYIGK